MSAHSPAEPGRLGRSVLAVLVGFVTVFVLSLATDQLFHALKVYPPWGQPMYDTGLLSLALAYRCVYAVLGSWIAARLAPRAPMRHAMILGWIGLVFAIAGAVATIFFLPVKLGPSWYPIALVLTTLPCAWLGGWLYVKRRG